MRLRNQRARTMNTSNIMTVDQAIKDGALHDPMRAIQIVCGATGAVAHSAHISPRLEAEWDGMTFDERRHWLTDYALDRLAEVGE